MLTNNINFLYSYQDYVNVYSTDLPLEKLKMDCFLAEKLIKEISTLPTKTNPTTIGFKNQNSNINCPYTTEIYNKYNLFTFTYYNFSLLFKEIQKAFKHIHTREEPHFVQAWLNIYRENMGLDWHSHWPSKFKAYHGYFCLDVEPSITTYIIPNIKNEVLVKNINNSIVIGKSDGDKHKTVVWEDSEHPRITIAFDIMPAKILNDNKLINHWIPI
jgi:hypothetical protein